MHALELSRKNLHQGSEGYIVCLHSSGSSGRQWNALREAMQGYTVLTPDLIGYGASAQKESMLSLDEEVDRIAALICDLHKPVHLVGHSYGGVIALQTARRCPDRILSLSLYEPVLFPLLFSGQAESGQEAWRLQSQVRHHVKNNRLDSAAKYFIDYWNAEGSYAAMPFRAKEKMQSMMPKIASEFSALILEDVSAEDLCAIECPTIILSGEKSPSTVKDVASILGASIQNSQCHCFQGLGHMAPVTHSGHVNALLQSFLVRNQVKVARFDQTH